MSFLASLLLLAAGEALPVAPPPVPDAEVPGYLSVTERVEWNSARSKITAGEARVLRGQSTLAQGGGTVAAPTLLSLRETPEQIKARGQKLIDDGNAEIQQASPVLLRLRGVAAARLAELTKPVVYSVDLTAVGQDGALTRAVGRLHKSARDLGFVKIHLVGALALMGDGKLVKPAALVADIRASWGKIDDQFLVPPPLDGYVYLPPSGQVGASISKFLPPPPSPRQVGVLWAEYYAVSAAGAPGFLFLRLADARTMTIIASEAAFTDLAAVQPPVHDGGFSLRDERSFLPRLGQSGDWVLGFDRASDPLGSAVLAHLCVTQTKVSITAGPYLAIIAGGGPVSSEGVAARWRATGVPADAGFLAYQVRSNPVSGGEQEIGRLTLRVGPKPAK